MLPAQAVTCIICAETDEPLDASTGTYGTIVAQASPLRALVPACLDRIVAYAMSQISSPEIYLGAPIDNGSERMLLSALVERLKTLEQEAVILANVFLPGRQIDFVLATPHGAWVVEVKASRLAVRGELNGPWARCHADGIWRPYRNAYQQALEAKYAVRDALHTWDHRITTYPSGEVVFLPSIPTGSALTTGDNKVRVRELGGFLRGLPTSGAAEISLATWRTFAARLGLERLYPAGSLFEDDHAAVETARHYRLAFTAQYGPTAATWLPEDKAQVAELFGAADGAGVHLSGPSGCGKTLMAHCLAVELCDRGHPVILVAGKDVAESWRDTVRREIGLLIDGKSEDVLSALRKAQLPLALVIDGLNEIPGDRTIALRSVLALARRYDAILIVTDQIEAGQTFKGLSSITISYPSLDLKRRIATAGEPVLGPIGPALEAVSSGLEAALIGRVKAVLPAGTTRLQLLERYARERLCDRARKGTLGLRRLAARLHADVAYSLPEVAFDDFMAAQGIDTLDADAILRSGLLVRRADRISFSHEMFLATFAAFDVASRAVEYPREVGRLLSNPLHMGMAADVVSAIDDADVCCAVLETTTNAAVLGSAMEGELGPLARSAAAALLRRTADACILELQSVQLELDPDGKYPQVDWAEANLREWSAEEEARLHAIGDTAARASFDLYMELCAKMDAAREMEWERLRDDARRLKIGLRSKSFALAYYNFGRSIGFSFVRHTRSRLSDARSGRRVPVADLSGFTSGQLHFVLDSRYALIIDDGAEAFAGFLIATFSRRYLFEPYHVRLALLSAAGFVHHVSQGTKARLVTAIEGLEANQNWALNGAIIDALKCLGALDDEAESQRDAIGEEVQQALAEPETESLCSMALSLCVRMFDHPFDHVYSEQIAALDEAARHTLLRRAASAPEAHQSLSLTWVIEQVVELADPLDCPRVQRFANLPRQQNIFPQEEWAAFVLVTRCLSRHGFPLPESKARTSTEICLTALRSIVYTCESHDYGLAQDAWRSLAEADVGVAIGCLSEVQRAISDRYTSENCKLFPRFSLTDRFPTECLALSRAFLDSSSAAIYHHQAAEQGSGAGYALQCVAQLGDRSDVPRVRRLTRVSPFAQVALETLRIFDTGRSPIS